MMRHTAVVALGFLFLVLGVSSCGSTPEITPYESSSLDRYVDAPDETYGWERVGEPKVSGAFNVHDLRLVSQEWNGGEWRHKLRIFFPHKLATSPTMVLLLIVGSGDGDEEIELGALLVNAIGAPVAVLHDVPNQPLLGGLREDALIAETLVRFLESGDDQWPLLLPMVKSAVRAMDAIENFVKVDLGTRTSGFVVTGGSKRAWTTWLAAAVDPRVKAIAPISYDYLNLIAQMRHQTQTWGRFSEKISDYTRKGIADRLVSGDDMARRLSEIVDPYEYRDRITVPKLMIVGTNDRYWPLDAMNLYYADLRGERYIQYLPNADHGLDSGRLNAVADIVAFFLKTDNRLSFPNLAWEFSEKKDYVDLTVNSDIEPSAIRVWLARSETRDFRDATWQAVALTKSDREYTYRLDTSEEGFVAILAEAVYGEGGSQFYLSTNVRVF
ncbi:MAG: PhoPQ-activated protein PqaA family protein [SAR202 cluster bacterium]|jgi:PhoPQ-activated pathogenicity-related protein|nr:PhoPQ-activated protein PqaA family protein [SAR202 cluster bacterium]